MKTLIDGDILLYRIGFTTQNDAFGIARWRMNETVEHVLGYTSATDFQIWLSDDTKNSWRYQLTPTYKANRTQPKPTHYEALKEYLIKHWEAKIAHNMEADDALGIGAGDNTIIASIDKDLLQVPGNHYNFVKNEFREITPVEGLRNFYTQILVGDRTDNIKGCPGIGEVKAGKALLGLTTAEDMYAKVVTTYIKQWAEYPEKPEQSIMDDILLAGRLLKIRVKEDEGLWEPPNIFETTISKEQGKTIPEECSQSSSGDIP